MAADIQSVIGARNLIGLIQGVVSGVPADVMPPAFLSANRSVEGATGEYTRVEGTRKTARLVQYGAPSVKRGLQGISEVPIKLLHTFEHQHHTAATLLNLQAEDSPAKQARGKQTIARQVKEFGTLFRNLRVSAVYSAFAKGAIYFDGDGNLLPSSSGAMTTVNFQVPAGNQSQLNVFGSGDVLNANWDTAATDLHAQMRALHKAARKLTGYPLRYAFYGENIPGYIYANTTAQAFITGVPSLSEQAAKATIPNGLFGFNWVPVDEAFFVDKDDAYQDWFGADQIVFTPAPSPDWYEFVEGSYLIPRSLNLTKDASAALGQVEEVTGAFSYATLEDDPTGIKHLAGDTFLPIVKVPDAIFNATVPTGS